MPIQGYNLQRIQKKDYKVLINAIDTATFGAWPSDLDEPRDPNTVIRDLKQVREKLVSRGQAVSLNRSQRESLWWFATAWASAHPESQELLDVAQRLWYEPRPSSNHNRPMEGRAVNSLKFLYEVFMPEARFPDEKFWNKDGSSIYPKPKGRNDRQGPEGWKAHEQRLPGLQDRPGRLRVSER
jgi:hypothetical protein